MGQPEKLTREGACAPSEETPDTLDVSISGSRSTPESSFKQQLSKVRHMFDKHRISETTSPGLEPPPYRVTRPHGSLLSLHPHSPGPEPPVYSEMRNQRPVYRALRPKDADFLIDAEITRQEMFVNSINAGELSNFLLCIFHCDMLKKPKVWDLLNFPVTETCGWKYVGLTLSKEHETDANGGVTAVIDYLCSHLKLDSKTVRDLLINFSNLEQSVPLQAEIMIKNARAQAMTDLEIFEALLIEFNKLAELTERLCPSSRIYRMEKSVIKFNFVKAHCPAIEKFIKAHRSGSSTDKNISPEEYVRLIKKKVGRPLDL